MIAARICMARMTVSVESQDTTEVRGAHVVTRGSYSRKGRLFPRPGSGREIGDRSGLNATPAGVGSSFENLLLAPARESFVDFHIEHSRALPQVSRREQCRVLRIRPPTPRPAPNPEPREASYAYVMSPEFILQLSARLPQWPAVGGVAVASGSLRTKGGILTWRGWEMGLGEAEYFIGHECIDQCRSGLPQRFAGSSPIAARHSSQRLPLPRAHSRRYRLSNCYRFGRNTRPYGV